MNRLEAYAAWVGVKVFEIAPLAAKDVIVARQFKKELLDLAEGRMTVCKECDRYNSKVKFCKECNCFMPAKTLWTGMVCPLDKW
tara:strand:- start:54 stop:305 length:252 start_codon:yes stop_codon:yes gene_type:complete